VEINTSFFENKYCKMWIQDQTLFCIYAPFLEINLEVAKAWVQSRNEFIEGNSFTMLLDISNLKFITREAREFLASEDGNKNIIAGAYIASTRNEKFLWEMFLKINRPPIPSKIFVDKQEALEWLKVSTHK